jgi:hypothetical protein
LDGLTPYASPSDDDCRVGVWDIDALIQRSRGRERRDLSAAKAYERILAFVERELRMM